ncbi:hypothetical protein N7493_001651 [Penicillium malachiteum]|uniref:Glucose-methanol-choline oxidoreductase N-terminal domain-containing protein n=1 Tax=Penicillium malachiteum TaxID=1324776 RepID=A0AAD6N0J3_9EURO|nr:hypothetical protein N7493_001651 [Penicillium malachiteum]
MASNLPSKADYLIIGGGTAGLVVASRLSEDPSIQVVVLENGPNCTEDPRVKDPNAWPTLIGSELDWQMKTVPQAGLNGRDQDQTAGKMLGGSSALNGLAWVPPSRAGLDAWEALGNPRWNWASLLPYINKSITVTRPGETPNGNGPIQVSYPALEEGEINQPLIEAWNKALKGQGYDFTSNIVGEHQTIGTRPYTATIDPESHSRSSADNTYAQQKRSNLQIITQATVQKIVFSDSKDSRALATGVEVEFNGQIIHIHVDKDVILAAGALHTPKLLELSGIGQKDRLSKLGIPVVVDHPGVGENLQNHVWSVLPTALKVEGVPPGIKTLAFTRLGHTDREQILLKDSTTNSSNSIIESILQDPDNASACLAFSVMPGGVAIFIALASFPFSRGNTHILSSDVNAKPRLDPQFFQNDIDVEILARHVQNLQQLTHDPAFEKVLHKIEVTDLETTKKTLREASALPTHHSCGTAAMLPREAGGVVNENCRVYGTKNVRVVDASIFPLIPHGNPMATVYAVAEKAVNMMKDSDLSDD